MQKSQIQDITNLLASTPIVAEEILMLLDERAVDYRHSPSYYSVKEIILHIWDSVRELDSFVESLSFVKTPQVKVEGTELSGFSEDIIQDIVSIMKEAKRTRLRTVFTLRKIRHDDWEKPLLVGDEQTNLYEVCRKIAEHEAAHLSQLRAIVSVIPDTITNRF